MDSFFINIIKLTNGRVLLGRIVQLWWIHHCTWLWPICSVLLLDRMVRMIVLFEGSVLVGDLVFRL